MEIRKSIFGGQFLKLTNFQLIKPILKFELGLDIRGLKVTRLFEKGKIFFRKHLAILELVKPKAPAG